MKTFITLLLLGYAAPSWAAIAHVVDDTCQGTSSSTSFTSAALSTNPTAGNTLLIMVRVGGTTPTLTVTSSPSGTWTQDATVNASATGAANDFIFSSSNVTGGSTTITIAINIAANSIRFCAIEVSGLTNTTPLDKTASSSGTSSVSYTSTATAATTVADEFVFGGYSDDNSGTDVPTAGSGFTFGTSFACANTQCVGDEWKIVSSTGAQTCTFTPSSGSHGYGAICATYKTASSSTRVPALSLLGVGMWIADLFHFPLFKAQQ